MIAYDRLSQIVPADQALACKALQVALQQINAIATIELPLLGNTVANIETTKGLPLLTSQPQVVPQDVTNFWLANVGLGTGECNSILPVDYLGTSIGWVNDDALNQCSNIILSTDVSGVLNVYTTMVATLNGDYTVANTTPNPTPPPDDLITYEVIIPGGTPGAGTYGPYPTANEAINDAFATGLIPAGQASCSSYAATNSANAAIMNQAFANICQQMGNEQDIQFRAGLNFGDAFANLAPNSQSDIYGFIFNLPSYGLDTREGGMRELIEGLANVSTRTGQAVVGCMREGQNQVALDAAGIQAAAHIPVTPHTPEAQSNVLISSTYTPSQAAAIDRNFPRG